MIKVSFSGFAGGGKTSLMNEVKKILSLKSKVESIDQVKGKNPFDSDKKSCFISQFFDMSTQINEENTRAIAPPDFLLCDRSVLDQWVYWNYYFAGKEMNATLEEKNNVLRSIYRLWIKTYDLIFLIRTAPNELEKRKFKSELRIPEPEQIQKTDEIFKHIIQADNLKVVEIWNNTTIDDSAHEILRIISEYSEHKGKENGNGSNNN
ncbi:MAG: AAA family ATPase [Candidatus Omnitrophota bacterium]